MKVGPAINGSQLPACFVALGVSIVTVVEFAISGFWCTSAASINRLSVGDKYFAAYCYC